MTKQSFPDLTYPVTKMYEGIKRQDYAQLSVGLVARIRDELLAFRPHISNPVDQTAYSGVHSSVMTELDQLEQYFKSFHNNTKPRISQTNAAKIQGLLIKELHALEELSKR